MAVSVVEAACVAEALAEEASAGGASTEEAVCVPRAEAGIREETSIGQRDPLPARQAGHRHARQNVPVRVLHKGLLPENLADRQHVRDKNPQLNPVTDRENRHQESQAGQTGRRQVNRETGFQASPEDREDRKNPILESLGNQPNLVSGLQATGLDKEGLLEIARDMEIPGMGIRGMGIRGMGTTTITTIHTMDGEGIGHGSGEALSLSELLSQPFRMMTVTIFMSMESGIKSVMAYFSNRFTREVTLSTK